MLGKERAKWRGWPESSAEVEAEARLHAEEALGWALQLAAVQLAAEEARRAAAEGEAGSVRTSTSAASFALLTFFAF